MNAWTPVDPCSVPGPAPPPPVTGAVVFMEALTVLA